MIKENLLYSNSLHVGQYFMFCCRLLTSLQINLKKKKKKKLSECQTVMSGLIWVETICKRYPKDDKSPS